MKKLFYMKQMLFSVLVSLALLPAAAQQKEGKVVYERTVELQITVAGNPELEKMVPKTRVNRFELNFANNRMLFRQQEDDIKDDNASGNGMGFRAVVAGTDDIVFIDFASNRKVEQRELFDKQYIITDSIRKGADWKITEDTRTILNHVCRKAVGQRIGKRTIPVINNGNMERKEVTDTTEVIAWFATDIPVPAGPEIAGQLPGLILELSLNNGKMVYKAIELSPKPALSAIKEPTKGKKITQEEFVRERNEKIAEMQKNNGGRFSIRM